MNPLNEVVTVHRAAIIKGCTVQHITRMCREGKLEAKFDGVWTILKSSISTKEEK